MPHRTAASPKETVEEGVEHDSGMPASKKMQGERGGGAALKENVCQVEKCLPTCVFIACSSLKGNPLHLFVMVSWKNNSAFG